jgi:cell division septal protein FtsQ
MPFFKRKPRNRRFERRHVLDVKLSAQQRQRSRWRRIVWITGGGAALFVALFAAWRGGEFLLRRFLFENPAFAIHTLDTQTDGVLALEQIRSWAGVRYKDNLLALDLARVKRDLELVPAIESVSVERVLPHTLRIRVTERAPIARVPAMAAGGPVGDGCRLDAHGFFMFPIEAPQRAAPPGPTDGFLPLILGIPPRDVRPGRQTELTQVRDALRFIQAFERSGMADLANLRSVDVSLPGVLRVATAQGAEITLGLSHFERQLLRWRSVHEHGRQVGRHLAWIDLSVANNVPFRWMDAGAVVPPVSKPSKASPYKKRHV